MKRDHKCASKRPFAFCGDSPLKDEDVSGSFQAAKFSKTKVICKQPKPQLKPLFKSRDTLGMTNLQPFRA